MLVGGAGSLLLASYWGADYYEYNVWKKVYLTMSLLMLIGIIANLISHEPVQKRVFSNKTNLHIKFFANILISVVIFIFVYSSISNPFTDKNFLSFFFTILKLIICFFLSLLL